MIQFALISKTNQLSQYQLASGTAAIQAHLLDFCKAWSTDATMTWFPSYCPAGYAPIYIQDTINAPPGVAGYHVSENGFPYAVVSYGQSWTLTASHECFEMIVDPDGMQVVAAPLPTNPGATVRFIKEVCDPCQTEGTARIIGQFLLSDFCLPAYFDTTGSASGPFSWSGQLSKPWDILDGGTLSWLDPDNVLYEIENQGGTLTTVELGAYVGGGQLTRREFLHANRRTYDALSHIDTRAPELVQKLDQLDKALTLEAKRKHAHLMSDIHRRSRRT